MTEEERQELIDRTTPVLERISEALYGLPLREAMGVLGFALAQTFAAEVQGRSDEEIQAAAERITALLVQAAREGNVAETFLKGLQ